MKIIHSTGKGGEATGVENASNMSSLAGINVVDTTTSRTVTVADQCATIEFTNAGAISVTMDSMATIIAALHTDDFTVTMMPTGAGSVTITPNGLDTINTGVSTIVLATNEYVTLQTDATGIIWNIVNSNVGLLNAKADQATTYTETEVNSLLNAKAAISGQAFSGNITAPNLSGTNTGDQTNISGNAATVTTVTESQVGAATAGFAVGAIGTYAFFYNGSGGVINPGDTVSGSSLNYANANGSTYPGGGFGTWRCMGYASGAATASDVTLFLRIS